MIGRGWTIGAAIAAVLAATGAVAVERVVAGRGPQPVSASWAMHPGWPAGIEQLGAGEPAAALEALRAAEHHLGRATPTALLEARLAAALAADALRDAETTVEKLVVRGAPVWRRDFVVGVAEYTRGVRARFEAEQPAPDPTALTRGIGHATEAAAAFQRALLARDGEWPEARRNAERALVLLGALRRLEEQRQRDRDEGQQPEPPEPDELETLEQDPRREQRDERLSAAELQALWRRLGEAEQEKRELRRSAQRARSTNVEQDW